MTPLLTIPEATRQLDPITVTIQEARRLTGLSHTTIYKLIGMGKLRAVKIGRRTLVRYDSLLRTCSPSETIELGAELGVKNGHERYVVESK